MTPNGMRHSDSNVVDGTHRHSLGTVAQTLIGNVLWTDTIGNTASFAGNVSFAKRSSAFSLF